MTSIAYATLRALDARAFQTARPFPWINPVGVLTEEAFASLHQTMPDVSLFEKSVGMERSFGQKPHDRYELKYRYDLPLSPEWRAFMNELTSKEYRAEMARLFGTDQFVVRFQWHYSFSGSSISPHCDSPNKIGSHLFYFNTTDDWDPSWGGRTLILDDHGTLSCATAPALTDFPEQPIAAEQLGNRSLLFMRTDHSWHAVEEIHPPEGKLRKLFTVIFEKKPTFWSRVYRRLRFWMR